MESYDGVILNLKLDLKPHMFISLVWSIVPISPLLLKGQKMESVTFSIG